MRQLCAKCIKYANISPALVFCGVQNNWTAVDNLPYTNSGDNTTGFVTSFGDASLTPVDGILYNDAGNGWITIPAQSEGNFLFTMDVLAEGPYVDLYFMFVDNSYERGFLFRASPSDTDTPECVISKCCYLNQAGDYPAEDGAGFFSPIRIIGSSTTDFVTGNWSSMTLKRVDGIFTFTINSQVLSFCSSAINLKGTFGIGYYLGGDGSASFRNLSIVAI